MVDVNRMFLTEMKMRTKSETQKFKDIKFRPRFFSFKHGRQASTVFTCQQNGSGKSEPLTDKIPNLLPTLQLDDEEKTAVYTGYLSGENLEDGKKRANKIPSPIIWSSASQTP